MKRSNPLRLERLEDRTNPSSLTVSFVPDGTQVGALHSELYQDYTGIAPAVWQQQLLGQLQTALSSANHTTMTLSIVPDDGAALNVAAPQDGALRIAAVNELFASDGSVVLPAAGTDFMVGGGPGATTFGTGLGLVGPNGQILSPTPTGAQTSGSMLPLILPVQKAYGNLYPTTPTSPTPTPTSPPTSPTGPVPTSPDGTPIIPLGP